MPICMEMSPLHCPMYSHLFYFSAAVSAVGKKELSKNCSGFRNACVYNQARMEPSSVFTKCTGIEW